MIQELLGGAADDRKVCVSRGLLGPAVDPPLPNPSSSSAASSSTTNSEQQNLRCPRCDSTNTKFCYYNNYNLTQPRHFCKTCRRYWTQGGALRNVPIGGGCRKTKSSGITVGAGKSAGGGATKAKPLAGFNVGVGSSTGFNHELHSNTILWAEPLNSQLLALLRATTQSSGVSNSNSNNIPIPNTNPTRATSISPFRIKEDWPAVASNLVPDASLLINALNSRSLGIDPLGLCSSLWKLQQQQQEPQQEQNNGLLLSEAPTSGIHELLQKLRSQGNYWTDHHGMASGNVGSSSSHAHFPLSFPPATAATAISSSLEPNPVAGGECGLWNAPFIWADMPNGAFP
ncbi:unnamed protein product [Spirodela intermedia]|uniref:Dof zinc finger protein n=1 Tax=Spirodela intermedia TaxID=51605 RepID=A0A7I8KAD6_SPIIN|nr:unnamed protein product [Spirodela intermedia]